MVPLLGDGHPIVSGTVVLVDGATASILSDALAVLIESYRRRGQDLSPRIEEAYRAFLLAGDRLAGEARFRRRNLGTRRSADEPMIGDMTSAQVAARLGITPRAVTKRAHALGGRKVAGHWVFAGVDVDEALRRQEP